MALRNSPALPEATRRRIQTLAENMGYSPDPALRALNAYRNGRRPQEKLDTIGYITDCSSKSDWQKSPEYARYFLGASRKAGQLGFHLEHFWLGEAGMSLDRLATVFFHRRINGAIFAPSSMSGSFASSGWSRICAVKIGRFPRTLGLHTVATDHAAALQLAVQHGISRGYRRIGIVAPPGWRDAMRDVSSNNFPGEQRNLGSREIVSPLWFQIAPTDAGREPVGPSREEIAVLRDWILKQSPDLVISASRRVADGLAKLGYSIPDDIGFLELSVAEDGSGFSGVRQNCEHVGAVALEKLVGLMLQNQAGIPSIPTTTFVEPSWIEGSSLRVKP